MKFKSDKELLSFYKEKIAAIVGFDVTITAPNPANNSRYEEVTCVFYLKGYPYGKVRIIGNNKELIAVFNICELPGCCAFMLSHGSYIYPQYRKLGLGVILNQLRIDVATYLEYSALLCTDIEDNEPQRKILKKNGWQDIYGITNKRTGNHVFLSVITLK